MPKIASQVKSRCLRFADRPYYPAIVSAVGAVDYFLPGAPTNAIFVASLVPRPRQWRRLSVLFALGCAAGAFGLAALIGWYESTFTAWVLRTEAAELWARFDVLVTRYGLGVLAILAVTPAPVRLVVAILAASGYGALSIAMIVLAGRLVAYPGLAWLMVTTPRLVVRAPWLGSWLQRCRPFRSQTHLMEDD
ncbi:hypothetical protein [Halomonas elongata]|uniref:hypothetical protein n=1 Tax=Halomonas elongata TaxID=2746 RepID=UPI0023B0B17A|nr:hypothetical protein [Halomonas elongata]